MKMTTDDLELAKEVAKEAVKQTLAPVQEIVRELSGPAATEVGLMLGDFVRVWRLKRAVKYLEDVKEVASKAGLLLKPVAPRLLFPILDSASLEDDNDLHQRWVALLTNAARTDFDDEVLPSFPDILKQLTAQEVQFLDRAYDEVTAGEETREIQHRIQVLSGFPFLEHPVRKTTLELIRPVMLDNLQRLMLLKRDNGIYTSLREDGHTWFDPTRVTKEFENAVYITAFGRAFVRACRIPKPSAHNAP
jgi:hypothetical protein